ncbi:bifunctional phosphopantothenoylcysteine decarboxylase/phosphopantothenate--cysteine ligase CoaBC [Chitinispirillales bacterium ANBcel5]|uniref:bifunctional phosphopantothenoylcysteine decarboxylase/phosphopantothenate--cysteine ligase CoaBC n=1 Tax=Cellulosispirillum alkaliphilum TaxID=3039283 RepID=UPI002A536DB3|nr:bifunctional phosphopantothenoylcysteine decarboxylase/phosphopantothenate--cysteine ligase CoaBC [Chitinispirillales bacterium ANBcel5]
MATAKRILLGITGGIAAYKTPLLIRLLKKRGCEVKVVVTENAKPLVGTEALRTVSENPVYCDSSAHYDMNHIRLSQWADRFLICPATANSIAKIACGIGDNLLTSLCLSVAEEKIIIAPAMNTVMWSSKATQANILTLKERGVTVLPVGVGELACNKTGPGRMIEIEDVAHYVLSAQKASDIFANKRILISSGPTEEPVDPVRVITNRSSGKMGAAIARAAVLMGAEVVVVTGPASVKPPCGVTVREVKTALEMKEALEEEFTSCDVCIMAAAVSDYRPLSYSDKKLHRKEDGKFSIDMRSNPDITAGLGKLKGNRLLVGFSLESGDNLKRAKEKMNKKNCDMMVYNRVDSSLGAESTKITLLFSDGREEDHELMDKSDAAATILQSIAGSVTGL